MLNLDNLVGQFEGYLQRLMDPSSRDQYFAARERSIGEDVRRLAERNAVQRGMHPNSDSIKGLENEWMAPHRERLTVARQQAEMDAASQGMGLLKFLVGLGQWQDERNRSQQQTGWGGGYSGMGSVGSITNPEALTGWDHLPGITRQLGGIADPDWVPPAGYAPVYDTRQDVANRTGQVFYGTAPRPIGAGYGGTAAGGIR